MTLFTAYMMVDETHTSHGDIIGDTIVYLSETIDRRKTT